MSTSPNGSPAIHRSRAELVIAIHDEGTRIRPDLKRSLAHLRKSVLDAAADICGLSNLETLDDLSEKELHTVLEAMSRTGRPVTPADSVTRAGKSGRRTPGKFEELSKEALVAALNRWEQAGGFWPSSASRFIGLAWLDEMICAAKALKAAADACQAASDEGSKAVKTKPRSGSMRAQAWKNYIGSVNTAARKVERARRCYERELARFNRAKEMVGPTDAGEIVQDGPDQAKACGDA